MQQRVQAPVSIKLRRLPAKRGPSTLANDGLLLVLDGLQATAGFMPLPKSLVEQPSRVQSHRKRTVLVRIVGSWSAHRDLPVSRDAGRPSPASSQSLDRLCVDRHLLSPVGIQLLYLTRPGLSMAKASLPAITCRPETRRPVSTIDVAQGPLAQRRTCRNRPLPC